MSRIFTQRNLQLTPMSNLDKRIIEVLDKWHEAHKTDWYKGWATGTFEQQKKEFNTREEKHAHIGARYIRLDVGTSGAWMLDTNGDIFGILSYCKVNRAKCVGNINDPSFNGEVLFRDRFRYGRFDNRKVIS
jgi:hypothetical protein